MPLAISVVDEDLIDSAIWLDCHNLTSEFDKHLDEVYEASPTLTRLSFSRFQGNTRETKKLSLGKRKEERDVWSSLSRDTRMLARCQSESFDLKSR